MTLLKKKPKVLFFANIPVDGEERSIGGATVLAEAIFSHLNNNNEIEIKHIQIRSFWRYKLQLIDYFFWVFRFPFVIRKFDVVSFHGTKDLHFTIAPILWLWARVLNKKIVYHFFGGNFHIQYASTPLFYRYILNKTILNSDTVFFETKLLINYFKKLKKNNFEWLPNSRKPLKRVAAKTNYNRRFVFISRIVPQKGIEEIIKVSEQLPLNYTIDVYGPIDSRHYESNYFDDKRLNYKGVLRPDEVLETLNQYDVKLLPSYFEGEGYPGILIECLSLGIPVITTDWLSLTEIVTDNYNGRVIPIKDSEALKQAVLSINEGNYPLLSENALKSFENFNSDKVFEKITQAYLK